jgi:hypothetical protein
MKEPFLAEFDNGALDQVLHAQSPRWLPPPTPLASTLIHGAVLA